MDEAFEEDEVLKAVLVSTVEAEEFKAELLWIFAEIDVWLSPEAP